jgi:hypothetical protein
MLEKIKYGIAQVYSSPKIFENSIEDKEIMKILNEGFIAEAKLHLTFLFASPLIIKYKETDDSSNLKSRQVASLDHEKELQGLVQSIKHTGNQIRYRDMVATLENLRLVLTENPMALHFSGHGIENSAANFGREAILLKDEGHFLVFEDEVGCARYISEKCLTQLLEASGT